MRIVTLVFLLLSLAWLVACGKDDSRQVADTRGQPEEQLPRPASTRGGVTGMPDEPGPGPVGPPAPMPAEVLLDADGNPILPDDAASAEALPDLPTEPTPEDAVAVIRDYYAAINRGEFARAYAFWSDGGKSSGQSLQQFASGFADTTGVSVELMPPGRLDAGAGSRYIEVPVAITATQRDGSQRRYAGAYMLRRAVVDGATPEQRAWRIGSADLREVQP